MLIQNAVRQKEKNKYCMLTHIYGFQKQGTDETICREGLEMQRGGRDGWDGWEIRIDTYIFSLFSC